MRIWSWLLLLAGCAQHDRFDETPAWASPNLPPSREAPPQLIPAPTPCVDLEPGSLVQVRMTATNPRGEEETKDALVFWPWTPVADVRSPDLCTHCIDVVPRRKADVVVHPGSLGVPDAWLAKTHVGDVLNFASMPPAWISFNARQKEFFHTTTGKVRWELLFACKADLRTVSVHYAGLKVGTPISLPDGSRVARWHEFHGCTDGQEPPAGVVFKADTGHLVEVRE